MSLFPRTRMRKRGLFAADGLCHLPLPQISESFSKQNSLSKTQASGESFCKASMTVEAALVFTLFLYCCGLFFTFFLGQFTALRLQKNLDGLCSDAARYSHFLSFAEELTGTDILSLAEGGHIAGAINGDGEAMAALLEEDTDLIEEVGNLLIGEAAAVVWQQSLKRLLIARVGEDVLAAAPIRGGAEGLSLKGSRLRNRQLDLVLSFTVESPIRYPIPLSYPVTLRSCRRLWVGTLSKKPEREEKEEEKEEPVAYVTETGKVYHLTAACRVLNIKPVAVAAEEVPRLRSTDGAKYYPCESCLHSRRQTTGTVYVTDDGRRYHCDVNCSKLKRSTQEIALSEAQESRRPCGFCAKQEAS